MCFPMNIRKLFHCEGDWALALVSQGGCRVSIIGNVQKPSGQIPGQLAPGGPNEQGVWTRELQEVPSKFHHSVILTLSVCLTWTTLLKLYNKSGTELMNCSISVIRRFPFLLSFVQSVDGAELTGPTPFLPAHTGEETIQPMHYLHWRICISVAYYAIIKPFYC